MTNHELTSSGGGHGVLASLRAMIPNRVLSATEALRLAERQAVRLLELQGVDTSPVPEDIILSLPRVQVRYHQLKTVSGLTYWNGAHWLIGINETEPLTRQRLTICHEAKHIIDHGAVDRLYRGDGYRDVAHQAESVADYFAGCLLVPSRQLKRAWYLGIQRVDDLARHFDVSRRAMEVRLSQVGIAADPAVPRHSSDGGLPARRGAYLRRAVPPRPVDDREVAYV